MRRTIYLHYNYSWTDDYLLGRCRDTDTADSYSDTDIDSLFVTTDAIVEKTSNRSKRVKMKSSFNINDYDSVYLLYRIYDNKWGVETEHNLFMPIDIFARMKDVTKGINNFHSLNERDKKKYIVQEIKNEKERKFNELFEKAGLVLKKRVKLDDVELSNYNKMKIEIKADEKIEERGKIYFKLIPVKSLKPRKLL